MKSKMFLSVCILFWCAFLTDAVSSLPNFTANLLPSATIGGFSSGGAMAVNLHVIYSSKFSGVAGFASAFYYCNSGPKYLARINCYTNRTTVATSLSQARNYELEGLIDPLSNLANSKAFFWSGTKDTIVRTAVTAKNVDFYKSYTSLANIRFVEQSGLHQFPTDNFGPKCFTPSKSFIANCKFAGTYEMLSFLYGSSIIKPNGSVTVHEIVYFNQKEFASKVPRSMGLDTSGFYYLPSGCKGSTKCRLHFFLHGCSLGNPGYIPVFIDRIGLLKLAEVNNIIMIFPRAGSSPGNPQGCWDVYGYNNDAFATKNGLQVEFFRKMIARLYGEI